MSASSPFSIVRGLGSTWLAVVALCGLANVLALTGAIYMLQIYDRVLASQSVPTLLALSLLAGALYLGLGAVDAIRGQILVRLASYIDETVMSAAYAASLRLPLTGSTAYEAGQPVRDADAVRMFLGGPGPVALLDLPWAPLFLGLVYLISPHLALATGAGLAVIVALTLATEVVTARTETQAMKLAAYRNTLVDAGVRGAGPLQAMGMQGNMEDRFDAAHDALVEAQARVGETTAAFGAASRILRLALQSVMVGLGAYLAIQGDVTAGAIIAASIVAGRALSPFEQAIAHWKGFVGFRQAWRRLRQTRAIGYADSEHVELPAPTSRLSIEKLSVGIPGTSRLAIHDVTIEVDGGTALGIAGESAAGKSSLARAIVGLWPAARGSIRLDGARLDQWSAEHLGTHIGYLPQDVELLPGTIAENIARMSTAIDSKAVIAAARAAGVHEMILRLPQGYDTELTPGSPQLSGGQRQRIGLARALYGEPFLVVLDEPNSNLDGAGEAALLGAIESVRARNGIAIVIAHRTSLLAKLDKVAILEAGRLVRITQPQSAAPHDLARARLRRATQTERVPAVVEIREPPHA